MNSDLPRIVVFVCNWCSYAGADAAGGQKRPYHAGVRLVRVMCSGRVEPSMVLSAYREGADGVMVLGCHPGDCHYRGGNCRAQARFQLFAAMLEQFGVNSRRFKLDWVAAAEGERFQTLVDGFAQKVQSLGPLRLTGYRMEAAQ